MSNNKFSKISSIIQDAKKGKMFILVDNKNRENEGDLIIPGSKCNSKNINFMAKHGRGLICLALSKKQIDNLKLPLMSPNNKSRMQTAFTISIEAKKGITTGISAQDRAKTIKTAIKPNAKKTDIVSPGHVFPLVAKNGGVLERAGHTEASVDISKLSKLNPSSVICEVMNEDGRMARLNDLYKFSQKHKIKLASIEDLISYRLKYEKLVIKLNTKTLYLKKNLKINIHYYKNKLENNINFVVTRGSLNQKKSIPVRVISTSINKRNILKNSKVKKSIKILSKFKNYLLLIINNQKNTPKDRNINTLRYYGIGAQIIKDLNVKNMILLSRSRKKIIGLDGFGLRIKKQIIITKKKFLIVKYKISITNVPGAFEIPISIRKNINKFDGFIALGCVIKGQTPHFDLLCSSLFNAILSLSVKYNKPIGNGVITAFNLNQAQQRSKINSKKPNKGSEAANAVISILKNGPKKI